jgi:hypothetical protein
MVLKTMTRLVINDRPVILESFIDITDQKATEEELRTRMEEVSESKRRMEVLVSNMSGREMRMVELKREVNDLLHALGRSPKYRAPDEMEELMRDSLTSGPA